MYFSKGFRACVIVPALVVSLVTSFSIKADVNWLLSNQNTDGSIAQTSDVTPLYQSTIESLETLNVLSPATGITSALTFINNNTAVDTEHLSRKIIVNAKNGNNTDALVAQLVNAQNEDSGWGELSSYNSTAIDTAFALQALSAAQYLDSTVISTALAYLYNLQMPDGGFAHSSVNASSVYVTAHASIALQQFQFSYNVSNYITAANAYLFNTELVNGGWSTHWETATALMAIVPATTDASVYLNAINSLQTSQQPDGSWLNAKGNSDVYITALALRALYLTANIKLPSLPTKGNFTGKVINASTGLPITGAMITMSNGVITNTITTSNDGRFALNNVEPDTYQFTYTATGLSIATQTASVQAGQRVDLGTTSLSPVPTTGVVQGTVIDAITNLPLSGVNIQITGSTSVSAVTNAAGQYSLQVVPGSITLNANLSGYISSVASVALNAGQLVNFSPVLSTTIPIDPTVTISGSLIDAANNNAITNGVVTITGSSNQQVNTDNNGQFTFTGLTAGSMTLSLTAPSYSNVNLSVVATEGAKTNIGSIQLAVVATKGTVQGVVIDAQTNLPLSGVNLQIIGSTTTNNVLTNSNGQYSLDVEPGNLTLTASLAGYIPAAATGSVTAGQVLAFSPSLSTTPPVDKTVTITGRVINATDNSVIPNATVIVSGTSNQQVTTDAAGQFTFTGLTAGLMTISTTANNYNTEIFGLVASEGSNLTVGDIALESLIPPNSTTINGKIYDAISGLPISGAEIRVSGTALTVFAGADGTYSIASVNGLSFSLDVRATGYLGQSIPVSLAQPTTTTVDVNLEAAVTNGLSVIDFNTTKSDFRSHEDVNVAITLKNTATESKQVKTTIELRNANNDFVQSLFVSNGSSGNEAGGIEVNTILPNAELSLSSKWYTSSYPPGTYNLSLKVFDATSNTLMAERRTMFTVTQTEELASLTLKVTPKFASVGENAQVTLSADYLNKSNIDTALNLSYEFKDINGNSIQSGQSNHIIDVSKTQGTLTIITFPYTFADSGNYQAVATVINGNILSADVDKTIVVAPSVRVEANQSISPQVVVPDGDKRIKVRIQLKGVESK